MSVIVDIVNAVVDLTDTVSDFITTGIYDTLTQWTAYAVEWAVVALFKAKLAALEFSWDVAQNVIADLNISAALNQAYDNLDSQIMAFITYLRIPDAVNIILSAGVTKFIFRFIGFN